MMSTKVENINQKIQFLTKSGIRLHILNILSKNPQNIKELVNTTQITYSTLSSNLHKLQQEKYIQKIKNKYYLTQTTKMYLNIILEFKNAIKLCFLLLQLLLLILLIAVPMILKNLTFSFA